MIDKRGFPASLGAGLPGIGAAAMAQIRTPKKEIPRRKAHTVKLFMVPEFHPNCPDQDGPGAGRIFRTKMI